MPTNPVSHARTERAYSNQSRKNLSTGYDYEDGYRGRQATEQDESKSRLKSGNQKQTS